MVRNIGEDQDRKAQAEEMRKRRAAELERAEVFAELGRSENGKKFLAAIRADKEQIVRDMVASKPDLASDGLFKGAIRIIDRIISGVEGAQEFIDKQGETKGEV
jgi:hypothetical protein